MFRYYLVLFCAFLVRGDSLSNNRAIKIVDLYNTDFKFLKDFLSSDNVEKLQYSSENIDYQQIAKLRQASDSFIFLEGELIKWCSYITSVPNSGGYLNRQSLTRNGLNLGDKTTLYLNEMMNKFIQMREEQLLNWDPNFEASIQMANNVLKLEIIKGKMPKGVNWNNLFAEAKIKGHAKIISPSITLDSNITRAIEIIENSLNQISYTTNTYEESYSRIMSTKCRHINMMVDDASTSTQRTLPSLPAENEDRRRMNKKMPYGNPANIYSNSNADHYNLESMD